MNAMSQKGFLSLLIAGALFTSAALAGDLVNIKVTGKVVAASCTLDNNGSYNIELGNNIQASLLNSATPYSEWKTFDVTMSDCPVGTTKVNAVFSGVEDSTRSEMYANASGGGYASNVAVELQRVTGGTNLGNGTALTVLVDTAGTKKAVFDLQARAYGTGPVMPGDISATITMDVTYN